MSVRSITARSQRRARITFTDTCRITIPGEGEPEFDDDSGQYTEPEPVTVYEGVCKMQVKVDINSNVVEVYAGERESTYLTSQLQLPVAESADVPVDATCTMLTCLDDPALEGRVFNIQGTYHKSQPTYRRFRCKEVVA